MPISPMIAHCESDAALTRVYSTYRPEFGALQRERAELYAQVGLAIAAERADLVAPAPAPAHEVVDA